MGSSNTWVGGNRVLTILTHSALNSLTAAGEGMDVQLVIGTHRLYPDDIVAAQPTSSWGIKKSSSAFCLWRREDELPTWSANTTWSGKWSAASFGQVEDGSSHTCQLYGSPWLILWGMDGFGWKISYLLSSILTGCCAVFVLVFDWSRRAATKKSTLFVGHIVFSGPSVTGNRLFFEFHFWGCACHWFWVRGICKTLLVYMDPTMRQESSFLCCASNPKVSRAFTAFFPLFMCFVEIGPRLLVVRSRV